MSRFAGAAASPIRSILSSIPSSPWFVLVGATQNRSECETCLAEYLARCGQPPLKAEWIPAWPDAGVVARGLDDGAALWAAEEGFRRRALTEVRSLGRMEALDLALNELSEVGYERIRASYPDEELARAASGAALWTASGAITWTMAEDRLRAAENPFVPKLRIFELGHWPLGLQSGSYSIF